MRRVVALIGLLATLPAATAGPPSAPEVLGTIEATVDGEIRTWYVVSGTVRGRPYASAVWYVPEGRSVVASVGGYDRADPPLDSFETDARGQPVSFGDYTGSTLAITLMPEGPAGPYGVELDESTPLLVFSPVATVSDVAAMYFPQDGRLEVRTLEVSDGRLRAEGTFHGTFRTMNGEGPVEITDGRFAVDGVPTLPDGAR